MEFDLTSRTKQNREQQDTQTRAHAREHLNYFLKRVHVLLHAVMGSQVGHKVAGVHAVEAMKERVHACVQVNCIRSLSVA